MMSLVRAQLGEPQQSSLLTTLFFYQNWLYVNSWGNSENRGSMSIVGVTRKTEYMIITSDRNYAVACFVLELICL